MTVQNSQRGKEYLETAQTLLRAVKTMTDLAIAAAHSSEGFVPARPQSPDLRSCATKVATTSQFDWRKAYGYGISKGTNLTAHLPQSRIPGIVLGLAVSALAVYANRPGTHGASNSRTSQGRANSAGRSRTLRKISSAARERRFRSVRCRFDGDQATPP